MTNESDFSTTDTFFAFALGIRLALESHGKNIHNVNDVTPILKRMQAIKDGQGRSFVSAHDDLEWQSFLHGRRIEAELCSEYLAQVEKRSAK